MTKEEVFAEIYAWQERNGESFVDYFNADIKAPTYMAWCLGRQYITPDQYNAWVAAYGQNKLEADDPNYFVYNEENDEDAPFAVVISEEWNEPDWDKAYSILSEFIAEIDVYTERLNRFLAEADSDE